MATIHFYEKPGCGNNTKQKVWLASSGHTVLAKSILTEKWTVETLRPFFGNKQVEKWFNPAAPRVKSGEVNPASFNETDALNLMLAEPLFIRRPLMDIEGVRCSGFDAAEVDAWIGLNDTQPKTEPCPICNRSEPCPAPESAT